MKSKDKVKQDISAAEHETNVGRRKILKTAGSAGAVAGVAAWHKPVLNAVMTPAHAQTSDPVMMVTPISGAGSSSNNPFMVSNESGGLNNIAEKALETVFPSAHAGEDPSGDFSLSCNAFSFDSIDYRHCVTLNFPDGDDRDGMVEVTLTGPDVYYNYRCFYDSAYQFEGVINFGDSGSVAMDDGCFSVSLGDVDVFGKINEAFDLATGTMIYTGSKVLNTDLFNSYSSPYSCGPSYGEGAYWGAELGEPGGSCMIGAGAPATFVVESDGICNNS